MYIIENPQSYRFIWTVTEDGLWRKGRKELWTWDEIAASIKHLTPYDQWQVLTESELMLEML